MAGLIIFPACFSFGISPDSGPSLIFITLPNVFVSMTGGRIWGSLPIKVDRSFSLETSSSGLMTCLP
mgnify:CR=1 FL=1